ncbi:MAG: hypothetical protein HYX34_04265 [Actinobacteria bacterium]|nr:hypothetical protein [Actinomycetota bacterium]
MAVVGLAAVAASLAALPVTTAPGARLSADEPYYVLTATSLWEDRNLDISDELRAGREQPYAGAGMPRQAAPRPDGSVLAPHDPLLPLLLAPGVGLAGWRGARATLAVLGGVLAALLVWLARRRLGVPLGVAAGVTAAFALTPPLTAYGAQVYPELPAALAVTAGIAMLTGPSPRARRAAVAVVPVVVALPWLSVKYVPVAATLAVIGVARSWRAGGRRPVGLAGAVFAVAAGAYAVFHRRVYGGWTVYAAGDAFTAGELTVVGNRPDYAGRTIRLVGLVLDRHFGLAAWAPLFLLAVPAVAALVTAGRPFRAVLLPPLAAGWANATWVALTMQGWWWPGRQVVVIVPCLVLAVAWWVTRLPRRAALAVLAAGGAVGSALWWGFVAAVLAGRATLVVDVDRPLGRLARAWRGLLPDDRVLAASDRGRLVAWSAALVLSALAAAAAAAPRRRGRRSAPSVPALRSPTNQPEPGGSPP